MLSVGCSALVSGTSGEVLAAPSVTTEPTNQTVTEGDTATFSVVAAGSAPLNYQWNKNGTTVPGATTASYTTPATTLSDDGTQFAALITNKAGNTTSNKVSLYVKARTAAPSIATQPVSQTVTAGQAATFSVTANGTSPLSYQWKKNGTAISGATSATYTTPATVSTDSGAQFSVVVSNSAGSVSSSTATLTVSVPLNQLTIWPSTAVPATVDSGSTGAVELGVSFKSDTAGTINGIRFYKSANNAGVHVGHLWSSTGTLLASVTFSGESASGWQQANFSTPVSISANTIYVASYQNSGHWSVDGQYFANSAVNNPP